MKRGIGKGKGEWEKEDKMGEQTKTEGWEAVEVIDEKGGRREEGEGRNRREGSGKEGD